MKKFYLILLIIFFCFSLSNLVGAKEKDDWGELIAKTNWERYSKGLEMAIKSDNLGLNVHAMQQIIRYCDHVIIKDVILDIVRMYRSHKDDRVRHLALVTLYALRNDFGLGIIKRDYEFECCPEIKHTMTAILINLSKDYTSKEQREKILASIYDF